jgi:hypothetical protein
MKRTLLLLLFALSLSYLGWGQVSLPHTDVLNYTVGQSLTAQTGWTLVNTSTSDMAITTGSLSYTGLPTSTGNKVAFSSSGEDAAKLFTQQTSGTVYYSFLLNITSLGSLNATGGYFTGFNEGTSTTYGGTVWTRLDGSGFDIGLNPRTTAANTVWTTGTTSINTTVFVVISYQIVSGSTNDVVKMWINPTPGQTEPAATLSATNGLTDLANLNRILIRQDGASATPNIEMDELRIGTTWADVTPSGSNTAPVVTTTAATNIAYNGARFNGNISSDGGTSVTDRGFCYKTSTGVAIGDNKTSEGGSGAGTFYKDFTGFGAETNYFYKAYATNSVGTTLSATEINFWTFSTEPSAHSTTFGNTVISQTQIDLSFDAASTITNADGYLILRKTGSGPTGLPTDGNSYSVGTDIGDATVAAIITSSSSTSTSVTSLSAGTSYYFELIPYNYNGNDGATYNYKIDGSIPGTNGSTLAPLDVNSKVEAPTSQTIASNIASIATGSGSAVEVFKFKISDLASGDVAATKVTQVKIKKLSGTADWTDHIAGASLWDGVSQISTGTVVITDADITFPITSGNLDIASGSTKEIALKIWLNTTNIVDNSTMVFTVSQTSHGFTADAVASTFASDFGAAVTGNTMTVSVEATKLAFVQQPTNVGTSANITPAVTVSANDANNNRDLDYVTNVAVSATGLTGSPVSVTPTAGLATFSTLSFAAAATGVTLDASSGSLTNSTSSSFDVLLLPAPGEIVINQISPDYSGASDEYIELVNRTNKTFDLSQLKIEYQSATGSSGSAGGNLTGSLGPYQYWLLSPNATITVGQISGLSRNGSITAGFAAASGQLALRLKNSPNTIIDGIAYGSVSTNNLGEGTSTASPPADGGLKRVSEGIDNNANSTDFTTVAQANIYLRNSNSVCIASTYMLPSTSYLADVVISGAAPAVTLTDNTTIAGKLSVASGSLTVGSAQALTVTVSLTNSAGNTGLVVKSDATSTGSLITTSTPAATVERYMSEDVYHYISSPVAAQAVSPEFINTSGGGALPSDIDFYTWNETLLNSWINIKQSDFTLNPAFETAFGVCKGYVYANSSSAVTKNFTGTINSGDKSVTLTKSPLGQRGWNMVGNPFPSTVAVNTSADATYNLLTLNTASLNDTREAIYLWNQTTPNTATHTTDEYTAINQASPATYLSPGQAFMVSASANSVSFSIPQTARKHGAAMFYKSTKTDDVNRFWLTVDGPQGNSNETMLAMIPGTTNGMDAGYDAQKLKGNVNISLYTHLVDGSEGDYAIQSIDQLSGNFVVPVGLDANLTGNYTFKAGRMDNLEAVTVQLEDRNSGTFTTLSNGGEYSIAVGTTGAINNRFFLHLKSTVGIDDPSMAEASSIYSYGNQLYIQNPGKAFLEVYSMTGQRVMASQINATGLYQTTIGQPAGYYVVRLTNASSTQVSKVFIK